MVWFILAIGMFNLAIGFAIAVYLDCAPDAPTQVDPPPPPEETKQVEAQPMPAPATVPEPGPMLADDNTAPTDEIPDEWLDQLESENIVAGSFVEASVQVLRLEVGKYRDRLIAIDKRVRECLHDSGKTDLAEVLADLKQANQDWLAQQADAADHLMARSGSLGALEAMGTQLEDVLLEQTAQIETTGSNIDHLDFSTDLQAGCRRLIGETRKLIDLAHALRDRMQESLLAVVIAEDRLDALDKKLLVDSLTGCCNRSGLERLFADLWRDDPNRLRQVSCAMVDVDRFARFLERFGATACDRLLASIGRVLDELVRDNRGTDVVSRFDGQRFIILMVDTGPRAQTSAMERIRKTVAESTFELNGDEFEVTVSCGVAEVASDDTTDSLYQRLRRAVRCAKKQGRNRTYLDEGNGAMAVDPPAFEVKGRLVHVA